MSGQVCSEPKSFFGNLWSPRAVNLLTKVCLYQSKMGFFCFRCKHLVSVPHRKQFSSCPADSPISLVALSCMSQGFCDRKLISDQVSRPEALLFCCLGPWARKSILECQNFKGLFINKCNLVIFKLLKRATLSSLSHNIYSSTHSLIPELPTFML